jgi:hypothetical protein
MTHTLRLPIVSRSRQEVEMNTRNLAGLEVSELGPGCMGMSEYYGAANEADAIATIRRALEQNVQAPMSS